MSKNSTHPRILFVIPEAAFIPAGTENRSSYTIAHTGGFADYLAELICNLYHLGVDVYVAQPDYRRIFAVPARNEQTSSGIKLPKDRVQLAEDRVFFYSKPVDSNSEWANMKISITFQREVINQIIPRIQPDLIHCYDWMTGLIPAAAKKIEIPCLFTVQKLDTARTLLSCLEDIGIDAAGFWQNLFYDRYPGSYEQTRGTNPLDLFLSGILAASHVHTTDPALLPDIAEGRSDFMYSSLGRLLTRKWKDGCACEIPGPPHTGLDPTNNRKRYRSYLAKDHHAGNQKIDRAKSPGISLPDSQTTAKWYIDLYETILQRPLITLEQKKVRSINKNNRTKASGVQAIPYPKSRRTRSYLPSNERISTPAMALV